MSGESNGGTNTPKRPHVGTRTIGGRYWWIGWVLPFIVPLALITVWVIAGSVDA